MTETTSTYDAKARPSELLRKVESGRAICISRHGVPTAEIRPIGPGPSRLADRIAELTEAGVLTKAGDPAAALEPLAERPGVVGRSVADRGRGSGGALIGSR